MPEEVDSIISSSSAKASGLAAIPVPLIDVGGMIYIQNSMLNKIALYYGKENDDSNQLILVSFISALFSKLISDALSQLAYKTNLEKILSESLIKASVCGFLTSTLGELYDEHFRNGGSLDSVSIDSVASYFKNYFQSDKMSLSSISSNFMDKILK